jgi:hypothetical protein
MPWEARVEPSAGGFLDNPPGPDASNTGCLPGAGTPRRGLDASKLRYSGGQSPRNLNRGNTPKRHRPRRGDLGHALVLAAPTRAFRS